MKMVPIVADLFAALRENYHKKKLLYQLYTTLKLISFSMTEDAKIQDHVDDFNDFVVDLENLGKGLSDKQRMI